MKSKEKYKIIIILPIICLISIIFYLNYIKRVTVSISTNIEDAVSSNLKISNASKIHIDDYILKNLDENNREEIISEEIELEYITKYQNNNEIPKGEIKVIQEGRNGIQRITKKLIYDSNGNIEKEEQISATITKSSIDKIIQIGTGNKKSNHKILVGDKLTVNANRANVMLEANNNSNKLATILKGTEVVVLEINKNWYKISADNVKGWVENTYLIYSTEKYEDKNEINKTEKNNVLSDFNFSMPLNKPSGLTLNQFKKVLSDDKDVNNIFEENAEYFYYIESQYNINGIFVAAVGIHESGWGKSNIAKNKYNLFGYGAYDSNPYNGAYSFSNYSEAIDLIARVFVKYYLNPKGTKIYDGNIATGSYYSGNTLTDVNKKYATDKNWANAVYKHMKYLYEKL